MHMDGAKSVRIIKWNKNKIRDKSGENKQSKKPEVEGFDFQGRINTQSLK